MQKVGKELSMLEFVGSGLLGGALGAISRLAPEIIKFFDRKNEREHELKMYTLETDLVKVRGEIKIEEKYVDFGVAQLDAMAAAYKEQETAVAKSSKWIANLSASVRPGIAWMIFLFYMISKVTFIAAGLAIGQPWHELLSVWSAEDMGLLSMVLGFYYTNRSIPQYRK